MEIIAYIITLLALGAIGGLIYAFYPIGKKYPLNCYIFGKEVMVNHELKESNSVVCNDCKGATFFH